MTEEKPTEACGRCSMTTVVDAANANRDGAGDSPRDPFSNSRIEVEESAVRRVSPVAWTRNVTARLNTAIRRLTYSS